MALEFLTAREKTLITDDFSDFIADTQVRVSITYKSWSSKGSFTTGSSGGTVSDTYSDSTINAFRVPITDQEARDSGGKYLVGDYRYMIKVADISTPKMSDRIVDGSVTRYIVGFSTDPLRVFHSVVARNI